MTALPPPNGTRTHPLTEKALTGLEALLIGPIPRQQLNAGVANRLLRGGLAEEYQDVSPYKTHQGRQIAFFRITEAGKAELRGVDDEA